MMRICHATNWLPEIHKNWGGAEQAASRIIKLTKQKANEIYVISTKPEDFVRDDLNLIAVKTEEDFSKGILRRILRATKIVCLPFDPITFFHSLRILRRTKPDLIHLHNFKVLSFSLVLSAKLLRIPTLLTVYDYWFLCPMETLIFKENRENQLCQKFHSKQCLTCAEFPRFNFILKVLSTLRRPLFNLFLKQIDAFTVLSQSSAQILESYGIPDSKIHIIRQPFPLKETLNKQEGEVEKFSILYIGWVQPRKGLHILLQAMPSILKVKPEAKLYVIGEFQDVKYERTIRQLIEENRINSHVSLLGRKPYEEVKNFLERTNVVVIPEQWENMSPVVVVEAMAFGKPIVASRVGGIPEFISDGKNGFLVETTNPSEFANKILAMLENNKRAKKMAMQAQKDIIKICNEREILNDLDRLYCSLVKVGRNNVDKLS